jgi:hypothetical protein
VDVGRRSVLRGAAGIGTLAALGPAAGCSTGDASLPARRVLFLGNSYTSYNDGLDSLFAGLAPQADTAAVAPGGMTLTQHVADGETRDRLADPDGWDVVVLQEQSQTPVYSYGEFASALQALAAAARTAGAAPVALATWTRPDSGGVTSGALAQAYASAAGGSGARVARAGEAFDAARRLRPDLELYQQDGHPTDAGSYLAACVLLRAVYGAVGPNGFTGGVDDDTARLLQGVAASV